LNADDPAATADRAPDALAHHAIALSALLADGIKDLSPAGAALLEQWLEVLAERTDRAADPRGGGSAG